MSNKTIYRTYYGNCPLTDSEESLTVTYKAVSAIGQPQTAYVLTTASCNADCAVRCMQGDNCPILDSAGKVIYE